jgi:hypothetical protein
MLVMKRSFSFEAKTFCLSAKVGCPNLCLEERRKGFVGYIFTSIQCSSWLVETAIQSQVKEAIAGSYYEGVKATMVHEGGNKAGRFLEVSVLTEGGRKGVIWLLEGCLGGDGGNLRVNFDSCWRLRLSRLVRRRMGVLLRWRSSGMLLL